MSLVYAVHVQRAVPSPENAVIPIVKVSFEGLANVWHCQSSTIPVTAVPVLCTCLFCTDWAYCYVDTTRRR